MLCGDCKDWKPGELTPLGRSGQCGEKITYRTTKCIKEMEDIKVGKKVEFNPEELKALLEAKVKAADIAQKYDVNVSTVYSWIKSLKEGATDPTDTKKAVPRRSAKKKQVEPVQPPPAKETKAPRSVWNSHTCADTPAGYIIVLDADSEPVILTSNSLHVGPINTCPWCGANLSA